MTEPQPPVTRLIVRLALPSIVLFGSRPATWQSDGNLPAALAERLYRPAMAATSSNTSLWIARNGKQKWGGGTSL
jgi:hypothetical protein